MANHEIDDPAQENENLQAFVAKAQDLLQPYFPNERRETLLHVFYTLLRDDQRRWDDAPLWQESGRDAIRALIGGFDPELGHDGTRRWAALLEPFLRRCCTLVPELGIEPAGEEKLGQLLQQADLIPRNGEWPSSLSNNSKWPKQEERPALLATARADQPAGDDTCHLSAIVATDRRNKYAHGQWRAGCWRERIDTAEVILLTCVRMIARHPAIERQAIYACASAHVARKGPDPGPDFAWFWDDGGEPYRVSCTDGFANLLLAHPWGSHPRVCLRGPRGVGLSTLGAALARCSVGTDGIDDHPLFLIGAVSSCEALGQDGPGSTANLDVDAFIKDLVGVDWQVWWVQRALALDWLGVVIDDLEGLGTEALTQLVLSLEAVLRKYPSLRVLTLRPNVLPASKYKDQRGVLGALGSGKTVTVLGRGAGGTEPEHPASLGFWLERGALACVDRETPGAALRLLVRSLRHDEPALWIDFHPACRKAASVVALNALAWIGGALDEVSDDGNTVPSLDHASYSRCLYDAFAELAEREGAQPAPPEETDKLLDAVHEALTGAGLVRKPTCQVGYRLALPSIGDCVSAECYPRHIERRWTGLEQAERDVLIAEFGTRRDSHGPASR